MSFVKHLYDFGKKIASGGYSGIKTGLVVGRHIIDASKLTAKELEKVPELRNVAQKFLHSENLKETEKIINKGQNAVNLVDGYSQIKKQQKILNGRRQLEQPD